MNIEGRTLVMIPAEEWELFKKHQLAILEAFRNFKDEEKPPGYLTAKKFMEAVSIRRTKFDQLVQGGKIKVIKKERKIYVPAEEVERYFRG